MIKLHGVSKIYRSLDVETAALNNIDLHVKEGEFVAIMGPSGCGKSTLLNVIGMIDTATSGTYIFDGHDISNKSEEQLVSLRRSDLGFIFQNFNLIDDLTVTENVELPLMYNGASKSLRRTQVREALELVGLEHRAKHKPRQLSGGQQQRVAIARAIVGDPKLILADEPTGNLDSANGEEVMEMLKILQEQGATIVMVTHSPTDSARADRIIHMLDGGIVEPESRGLGVGETAGNLVL